MFDVAVIGGGVIGGMILRELTRYDLKVCLLEKENDVCMGQSKANSGIVHAGFDAKEGTLKAKFNVLGSKMMPKVAKELGVKFINNGSVVVAFSDEDLLTLNELKERGERNGVSDLEIIPKEKLSELEPNVSPLAVGALYAKSGSIICPYELTVAAIGNAMDNGAALYTNFEVAEIDGEFSSFSVFSSTGEKVEAKIVVDAAGLCSDKIAALVGDNSFKMGGRRGEYILLDKDSGDLVSHTLFFTPTKKGKGILVTKTVDGNILLGPTAEEIEDGSTETTADGIAAIKKKAAEMCKAVPFYNTITSFAGVRAYSDRHDFIIEESAVKRGFIIVAGIESPGLTSAPAIAEYVANELIGRLLPLKENKKFVATRTPDHFFKNLTDKEKNEVIARDKTYGHIVCRCETITEGEIRRALRANPKATDIDGVKRRTRAGMGRCQGGFCQPYVAEIIAEETGKDISEITKFGKGSEILTGRTK